VRSFADVYQSVIEKTNTGARVASLPSFFLLPLMKLAFKLGLSPLGPYQYKMIASNFLFDTKKIKEKLDWKPTITNDEMLWKAYEYYHQHRQEIEARTNVSAHKKPAKMGVIRLLKWMS
jgi:UDP-glucose 4-epimerase